MTSRLTHDIMYLKVCEENMCILNRKILQKALPSKFGEFTLQEREQVARTSSKDHRRQEMGTLSKWSLKYETSPTLR